MVLLLAAVAFAGDYATVVKQAQTAHAAGNLDGALRAWQDAAALSDHNRETQIGQALVLVDLGRTADATAIARQLIEQNPQDGLAHAIVGWSLRARRVLPQAGAWSAARAYQDALDIGWPVDAGCGLGWMRSRLGDAAGARAAFTNTLAPCAADGLAAHRPTWTLGGAAWGTVSRYQQHTWREQGSVLATQVGAQSPSGQGLDLTLRRVRTQGTLGPPGAVPEVVDTVQPELWARATGQHRGWQGGLLYGHITDDSDESTDATRVLGAHGQWTGPLTGRVGAVVSSTGERQHQQLDLDASTAVTARLRPRLGLGLTRLPPQDADPLDAAPRDAAPDTAASVRLGLDVQLAPVQLAAGVHLGRELRPVRTALPAIWNIDEPLQGSAWTTIDWTGFDGKLGVFAGYHALSLAPPPPLPGGPTDLPSALVHTVHIGIHSTWRARAPAPPAPPIQGPGS